METKKSIVKSIQENQRSWDSPNGKVFYHAVSFENGDTGNYGSKTEKCEKFVVGKEHEYTIEQKVNGNYTNYIIKPVAENKSFTNKSTPKDASLIAAQSCLGYACNLTQQSHKYSDIEYVLGVAEQFHKWVMSKQTNQ